MTDQSTRRSDRATKGQHNSRRPSEDASTPKTTTKDKKAAKAGKRKSGKQQSDREDSEQEDDEEETEDVIRCVCGDDEDEEEGRAFIQCDKCDEWQHNVCMGVPLKKKEQPDHYWCERCKPENHQELIAAMARGESLWEERQASQQMSKGKAGRRKSTAHPATTVKESAAEPEQKVTESSPTVTKKAAGSKKRHTEMSPQVTETPGDSAYVAEDRRASSGRADKRRKSSAVVETPKAEPEAVENVPMTIDDLPRDRQNVVSTLVKVMSEGIRDRSNADYRIPDGHTADSLGKQLAFEIEGEMSKAHWEVKSAYPNQFRQVNANLKNNPALLDRLLDESLTPIELAVMSSQEMASDEAQRREAQMKKENDKQAVLRKEDEDKTADVPSKESLTESAKVADRREEIDEAVKPDTNGIKESADGIADIATPMPAPRRASADLGNGNANIKSPVESAPKTSEHSSERRASQQQFDINSVWAKTQHQSPVVNQADSRRASGTAKPIDPTPAPVTQTQDADIDRLLADGDDNEDDEPYNPAEPIPSDRQVIWRGKLIQTGVAETTVAARFMAGNDFSIFITWERFLPDMLDIEGRIEHATADDYLCGLQWSSTSDVSVIALTPDGDDKCRQAFDMIFDYFHSRQRYAVGRRAHGISELVKDFYISPVEANTQPPPHMARLEFCGIKFPCSERVMLATFVVNKPPTWTSSAPGGHDAADGTNKQAIPPGRRSLPVPAFSPTHGGATPVFAPPPAPQQPQVTQQGQGTPMQAHDHVYQPPIYPTNSQYGYGNFTPTPQQQAPYIAMQPHQGLYDHAPPPFGPYNPQPQQGHAPGSALSSARVRAILGPHEYCPVAIQLLQGSSDNIEDFVVVNIRGIMDRVPAARESMEIFQANMQH